MFSTVGLRRLSNAASASYYCFLRRGKTTCAQYVAARAMDPTFEKLMEIQKIFLKILSVRDLILASPSHSLPLPFLVSAASRLRLNRGAPSFLRKYPNIFALSYDSVAGQPVVRLTPSAAAICNLESSACCPITAADRLRRLLSLSVSCRLPLRAVFRVWRELGLPDDFEDSVIASNSQLFSLRDNPGELNTHFIHLAPQPDSSRFVPAIEIWRKKNWENVDDEMEKKFGFKQAFPPGMRVNKIMKRKLKEWQRLPYVGLYEELVSSGQKKNAAATKAAEKRAVAMMHEFLSLTVEGMVEVEQVSHFRRWFGIELNIRDLFLDHPGIFYLSTKGKRHTVFLRERYERGRLVESNDVYEARQSLRRLVLLRKRVVDDNGAANLLLVNEVDSESGSDTEE